MFTQEEYTGHIFHNQLNEIIDMIESVGTVDVSDECLYHHTAVLAYLKNIQEVTSTAIPYTINKDAFLVFIRKFDPIRRNLISIENNPTSASVFLHRAYNAFQSSRDNPLEDLKRALPLVSESSFNNKRIGAQFREFKKVASFEIEALKDESQMASQRVDEYLNDFTREYNDLSSRANVLEKNFADLEDTYEKRVDTFIHESKAIASELFDKMESEHAKDMSKRHEMLKSLDKDLNVIQEKYVGDEIPKLGAKIQNIKDNFEGESITHREAFNALKSELVGQTSELEVLITKKIDEINELKKKAEETVGAIGGAGQSHAYKKAESHHFFSMWFLRGVVVLCAILAFEQMLIVVESVKPIVSGAANLATGTNVKANLQVDNGVDYTQVLKNLPLMTLFLFFAGYAMNEASKHGKQFMINQRRKVELTSLQSFLEGVKPEEREKLRGELVHKYFGHIDDIVFHKNTKGKPKEFMNDTIDAIRNLVDGKSGSK